MTAATAPKAAKRLHTYRGVQALRGFAACLVVAVHATMMWVQRAGDGKTAHSWQNGNAGVDIFFVISGFVMAVSTAGRQSGLHAARNFLARRLIRILPLYWLMTAGMWLKQTAGGLYPALRNFTEHVQLTPAYLAASILLIPCRNSMGTIQPLLFVGWSLSFEMFFYLLFAVALALRIAPVRFLTPVLLLLVAAGALLHPSSPPLAYATAPMLLEFLFGVLLGHATLQQLRAPAWVAATLGLLGLAYLLFVPGEPSAMGRILHWGLPALLVVHAAVALEDRLGSRWPRGMLLLGDASYALYLCHPLVFPFVHKLLTRLDVLASPTLRLRDELLTVAVCLAVTIPVAIAIHRWIERPMTNWCRRRWLHEGQPVSESAT